MTSYSPSLITGDGTTSSFTVPFDYINRTDVQVTVNGVSQIYTWTSAATIAFNTPPAPGDSILIKRRTEPDALISDFRSGTLNSRDLNRAFKQLLFIYQEQAYDLSVATIVLSSTLPTSPGLPGTWWNNGGVICIS